MQKSFLLYIISHKQAFHSELGLKIVTLWFVYHVDPTRMITLSPDTRTLTLSYIYGTRFINHLLHSSLYKQFFPFWFWITALASPKKDCASYCYPQCVLRFSCMIALSVLSILGKGE